jgi:hypothetical protein
MSVRSSVTRRLRKESQLTWRYVLNTGPTVSYLLHRPRLDDVARRVVADLDRDGIAITSVEELFGDAAAFEQLQSAAELVASSTDGANGEKEFLDYMLGELPALDPTSPFGDFALDPRMLDIANAYFRMFTQLRFYNVWRTKVSDQPARASQLWHRDREDFLLLKVFVHLRDVDEGSGPFRYARGTHPKGSIRGVAPHHLEGHVERSTDADLALVVPEDRWIEATGPAGTIVFADTRGYHCGGLSRERERLLFTMLYTSRDSGVREWFTRPDTMTMPPQGAPTFAIGAGRRGPAWVGRRR